MIYHRRLEKSYAWLSCSLVLQWNMGLPDIACPSSDCCRTWRELPGIPPSTRSHVGSLCWNSAPRSSKMKIIGNNLPDITWYSSFTLRLTTKNILWIPRLSSLIWFDQGHFLIFRLPLRFSQRTPSGCHLSVSWLFSLLPVGRRERPAFCLPGVRLLLG